MQYEIELFNLKFLYTCASTYMLKLPIRHFGQNVFLKEVKIQALNQLWIQVLNQISSSVEQGL